MAGDKWHKEVCHHPAARVVQKHDPHTGEPTYWCRACVKQILNVPKKHCIHAKRIGHCFICEQNQKGLLKYIRRDSDEKGNQV